MVARGPMQGSRVGESGQAATRSSREGATAREPAARPAARGATPQASVGNRVMQARLGREGGEMPIGPARGLRLPGPLERSMQAMLPFDVSKVRVQPEASLPANVEASATGQELRFAPGRYQPTTIAGRWLIAHELAHVGQQLRGAKGGSTAGAEVEREAEADRVASAVMQGRPVSQLRAALFGRPQMKTTSEREEELRALAARYTDEQGQIVPLIRRPGPDPAPKVKDPFFPLAVVNPAGSSGLAAIERTGKRTEYPGSVVTPVPFPGQPGRVLTIIGPRDAGGSTRSTESTQSALVNQQGVPVVKKQIDSDKTAYGVTVAAKGGTHLPDGTEVSDHDAELFIGRSEKTTRAQVSNKAATSEATTFKTFNGSKVTVNGLDAGGDFVEHEDISGKESRRIVTDVKSRNAERLDRDKRVVGGGQEVARERAEREISTDGRTTIRLRNTGTKYQGLDFDRSEVLKGRRLDRNDREVEHADGTRQRESSSSRQRGTLTSRERSERLVEGYERRRLDQSSLGTVVTTKLSELSRADAASRALAGKDNAAFANRTFSGKGSADAAIGLRSNTTFTAQKPGALAIAPRVQPGTRLGGGQLGLVGAQTPDPRTVIVGDKKAYDDPAHANDAGGYTESLAFSGGSRITAADDYELTERGVSANVTVEAEAGTLRSFLRKDRLNFGWLIVENALTNYYLAGVSGKLASGVKAGVDANNVNASASGSVGFTRRVGDEVTIRLGEFFVKIKAEGDAFAGVEAALGAEVGYTRGAGAGAGANVSAFAGARAGLGGKLEGGYAGVSFAAGAYKLRGSAGVGFKANIEARYQNGYFLLSGGLGLSAELGVGAEIELRINPTAVAAALVKGVSGLNRIRSVNLREAASSGIGWARKLLGG